MKIAMIGTRGIPAAYGGTEAYVEKIAHHLAREGDEVVVYCAKSKNENARALADASVPRGVVRVEMPSIPTKHLDNITRTLLSTLHACADKSIDVVQINNAGPAFFSLIPRIFGKRVVGAIRAVDSDRAKWNFFARTFLKFCEFLITSVPHVTTANAESMRKHFEAQFKRPVIYIPNGVDPPSPIGTSQYLNRHGLAGARYVLFAARLEPEKGCHTLIQAFKQTTAYAEGSAAVVIAGREGYTPSYNASLHSEQSDLIKFVGHVSGSDLDELFRGAFAFVLPSSIEGMSNALLSAMSYELPVVVSSIPENVDVIGDAPVDAMLNDRPGLVFELGDVGDLAAKLDTLFQNESLAKRRGKLLGAHVRDRFSLDDACAATRQIYIDLMDGKSRAAIVENMNWKYQRGSKKA